MHPSAFLYYAGAFAVAVVGTALGYALVRLGNALGSFTRIAADVEKELPETLKSVRETAAFARTTAENAAKASGALASSAGLIQETVGRVAGTITYINDNLLSKIAVIVNVVGFVTDGVAKFLGDRFTPKAPEPSGSEEGSDDISN